MSRSWAVRPIAYAYWKRKAQFLLEKDVYKYWTLFAVEEGSFRYQIQDHSGEAEFGEVVVCPPGIEFARWTISPLTFHFVQFEWEEEPNPGESASLTGKLSIGDQSRLRSTYAYLCLHGERLRDNPEANNRFRHMLNDVWNLIEMELDGIGDVTVTDTMMKEARQWLVEHGYKPFRMKELSDRLGLSPVQFTRKFYKQFQMNPSDFVLAIRMDRACQLLKETRLPLDSIAQQCGYENGFYLSRIFRVKMGMNPSLYRKLHQL